MHEAGSKIDEFLAGRRLGVLTTREFPKYPAPRPVWFEWSQGVAHLFSAANALKVGRLERDPRATLLVANQIEEPEFWVAIEGSVTLERENVLPVVERLAHRYWGPEPGEEQAAKLALWRQYAEHLVHLTLKPERVSNGTG